MANGWPDNVEKPPLGLLPRDIWHAKQLQIDARAKRARAIEVTSAIFRYLEAEKPIPYEWVYELSILITDGRGGAPSG